MRFCWEIYDVANVILTFVIFALIYGILFALLGFTIKRKTPYFILGGSFVLAIFSYIFCLFEVLILIESISSALIACSLFANLNDLRVFLSNPFKRVSVKTNRNTIDKIYDRRELYSIINETVMVLSKSKTGALMTFEKNDDITSISKNGVAVDAPVSKELLCTIFFPGTRLHDGAVVIHGNIIKSASVFFTPSTQNYTNKYGSRHRAAIGISEVCDAITVVVSEETGRISIAVGGQIESVSSEDFLRVFENYMLTEEDNRLDIYE